MQDLSLIDPQTATRAGMTPLEAEAVIEMWRLQRRLEAQASGLPYSPALDLEAAIPQKDLKRLLKTVRATYPVTARTPRPLITDVRLAIAVVLAFLAIMGGVFGYMNSRRSQLYFTRPPSLDSVRQDAWGMTVSRYRFSAPYNWFRNASTSPERFAFLRDEMLFEPTNSMGRSTKDDQLRSALRNVVGGPLGESSSLLRQSVNTVELERLLDAGPSGSEYGSSYRRAANGERLIEWHEVSVAFGGKVVSTAFPYARASDEAVRAAVQAKQAQLIEQLVKAGTALSRK